MRALANGIHDVSDLEMMADLGLALVLSTLIGLEREIRVKSAGLRTHTLVGVGSALFMLVSKFGFTDIIAAGEVTLDPSRVAAQVVSGIGFIGGGLIFVRRDAVRGLTTAATVWVVCAVGMAAGAGMPLLAIAATGAHFVVVVGYSPLQRLVLRTVRGPELIRITYEDGHGVLRRAIQVCTHSGLQVSTLRVEREDTDEDGGRVAVVSLQVTGKGSIDEVANEISELPGVDQVSTSMAEDPY